MCVGSAAIAGPMAVLLKLFGGVSLQQETDALSGSATQRHRLALLAVLATSHADGVPRDRLMALLWPERDHDHARKLLNQAVYALRQALGEDVILSGAVSLRLDNRIVWCDVLAFEERISTGELDGAVALYAGPFLDGFFLSGAAEFERWVDRERERLAIAYASALESVAGAAEARGDFGAAVNWWKRRAAEDPYDSRVALRLMQALEASGNPAGALRQAAIHERLLREDLGIEPAADTSALAERLRIAAAEQGGAAEAFPLDPDDARPVVGAAESPRAGAPGLTEDLRRGLSRFAGPAMAALLIAAVLVVARPGVGGMEAPRSAPGPESAISVDEIARAVAREVDRRLRGDTADRRPELRTRSIAAYELYLRGSDPAVLRSDNAAREALEYIKQAVELDSTYAAAYAALARLYTRVGAYGPERSEYVAQAEEAARRAIALDDSLAEAHGMLGVLRMEAFDFPAAERHLRHAIELEPDHARMYEWLVTLLLWTDRPSDALASARRALELTPLSPSAHAELARALLFNDRCDEAMIELEKLAQLQPPLLRAAPLAAQCYARLGLWTEAIEHTRSMPPANYREGLLGYLLARSGRTEDASRVRDTLIDDWRDGGRGAVWVALTSVGLGDREEAFVWLNRAIEDGSLSGSPGSLTNLMAPLFEELRADPRFEVLRARLGLQNR
jgi:DNA-binding SARP family transcriptional activator/Tfp pilus assembly protein PilF